METTIALAGVLTAVLIGAISPGPSFLFVARTSMAHSRQNGMAAAVGMGVGGAIFAALAVLGLKAVFASHPWLFWGVKVCGGGYLAYIGVQMWRGADKQLTVEAADAGAVSGRRAFIMALATQLSNPKTAIFYGSIFAALLPQSVPMTVAITLPLLVFIIELGWYAVVALLLSAAGPRSVYLRSKALIDRTAGSVMGLLGLKLMTAADSAV